MQTYFMTPLAKALKEARKSKGLTLKEVASRLPDRSRVHYVTIHRFERGKMPEAHVLGDLARLFRLDPNRLVRLAQRSAA